MKKFRHLYIEMYGINVYYIRCSRLDYERRIKTEFDCNAPKKSRACTGKFEVYERGDTDIGVIWLSEKANLGHLVHECLHATHYFLHDCGLFLSDNSEEAYAYLIQHIFKKTKSLFRKKR